jgi:hypothetical protein
MALKTIENEGEPDICTQLIYMHLRKVLWVGEWNVGLGFGGSIGYTNAWMTASLELGFFLETKIRFEDCLENAFKK